MMCVFVSIGAGLFVALLVAMVGITALEVALQ